MRVFISIIIWLLGLFILIFIIWRFASRRSTMPCPSWLGWLIELDNPFCKTNCAINIIEHLNLEQGMKVLDVGCGPGRLTIPVAIKVGPSGEVVAMDIQAGMLSRVKEKVCAENLQNIKFLEAGIGEKKLEHNKFDIVLLVTVLGEIPDFNRKLALQEIFDILKPGGILSVTEIIFDPHFQRRSTVLKLTGEVGFRKKVEFGSCIAYTLNLEKPLLEKI